MKIVQINAVNKYSSTGSNTYELHRYLVAHGHESYIFCTNESNPSDNTYRIGNRVDRKLHALLSRITGKQGYHSTIPTRTLIKKLETINPDVVLLGNLHGNYINLKILFHYLSSNNIAVVNVLHDCWSFTGHCCHYTKINCQKWQNHCFQCPLLKEDNVSYVDKSEAIFSDKKRWFHSLQTVGVVGVSDWIKSEARRSPIFPKHTSFSTIYNWIDLDVFHPQDKLQARSRLRLDPSSYYAISVSHKWTDAKGLTAILSLALSMPDVKFIIVGERPYINEIPENIIFPGTISHSRELSEYYSAVDVYLNFSKQETFGKVSAEAMACGLPILSSDTTASPEVVGNCGISIDTTNSDAVLKEFKKFVSGEISISRQMCRNRAIEMFSKEQNLGLYLACFEKLLKLKKSSACK